MNIIVKTSSGRILVRPDTTWERDNEDLFVPEFVSELFYTPVLFARISKPGRSVPEEFAGRYFDGIGYGMLLYTQDIHDGSPEGFACASCLDHTSFLPFPVYNKVTLGQEGNMFELFQDGKMIFSCDAHTEEPILQAIAEATRYVYFRTGDILAIELAEPAPLAVRSDGTTCVKGTYCSNPTLDYNISF